MDDLISRQAAIDAIVEITYDQTALHHGWIDPWYAVNRLEYLPTAEPRTNEEAFEEGYTKAQMELKEAYAPRKGRWMDYCGDLKCDQCGCEADLFGIRGEWWYCPNCGAEMREDDNDER